MEQALPSLHVYEWMLEFSSHRHRGSCVTKDTQYFLSQGLSVGHIKKSRIAWICLTESMSDTDLLDRVFAKQSPSGAWKMVRDWFLPSSIATQVKWSDAFDAVQMEKGEQPKTSSFVYTILLVF